MLKIYYVDDKDTEARTYGRILRDALADQEIELVTLCPPYENKSDFLELMGDQSVVSFIPFNILGGLLLAWMTTALLSKLFKWETPVDQNNLSGRKPRLKVWIFSVTVGVFSHLGFDLIAHDTNLLLYPWYQDVRWFPEWWYTPWYVIQPPLSMGPAYSVGIHTIIWLILSTLGTFLFYQFVIQKIRSTGRFTIFPRV